MPRHSPVLNHPRKEEIDKDLLEGDLSHKEISRKYDVNYYAIRYYVRTRMAEGIRESRAFRDINSKAFITNTVDRMIQRLQMMFDSFHETLLDPNDETKYTTDPWAKDVWINYTEIVGDKEVRRRERLDELLKKMNEETGKRAYKVEVKTSDPREMLIKTADSIERQLELLSKLQGHITEALDITLQAHIIIELRKVIVDATKGHPEVRKKIATAIESLGDNIGRD